MNEDKILLQEKELFYLWGILYKPHVKHKTKIQIWDTKYTHTKEDIDKNILEKTPTRITDRQGKETKKIQSETEDKNISSKY